MTAKIESPSVRAPNEDEQLAKRRLLPMLERDRARWMLDQPFLGSLAMRLELVPVVDSRLPTAATDGERIFFSVHFAESLDASTRRFVLAHEVWHCAALHFPRRGNREPRLWNLAIDHETNSVLRQQGFDLPEDAVHFPRFVGKNAETVYAALQSDRLQKKPRGPLADLHDPARRSAKEQSSVASGEGASTEPKGMSLADSGAEGSRVFDPDYAPGAGTETNSDSSHRPEAEAARPPVAKIWDTWPRHVVAAAQIHKRNHGSEPGWMQEFLALVGAPSVPWQERLRRFTERCISDRYRWTRPNRRFLGQGLFLPSRDQTRRIQLAVGLDASGSTIDQVPRFMAELHDILHAFEQYTVRVVACDTRIVFDEVYDDRRPLPATLDLGEGGGGTELQPVFDAIERDDHAALVYLTDGFASAPKRPRYPVLWALTDNGQAPADWAEIIRLDPPQPPGKR